MEQMYLESLRQYMTLRITIHWDFILEKELQTSVSIDRQSTLNREKRATVQYNTQTSRYRSASDSKIIEDKYIHLPI